MFKPALLSKQERQDLYGVKFPDYFRGAPEYKEALFRYWDKVVEQDRALKQPNYLPTPGDMRGE